MNRALKNKTRPAVSEGHPKGGGQKVTRQSGKDKKGREPITQAMKPTPKAGILDVRKP